MWWTFTASHCERCTILAPPTLPKFWNWKQGDPPGTFAMPSVCSHEQFILILFAGHLQDSIGMCVASLSPVERRKKRHAALQLAHIMWALCARCQQHSHFPLPGFYCHRSYYSQDSSCNLNCSESCLFRYFICEIQFRSAGTFRSRRCALCPCGFQSFCEWTLYWRSDTVTSRTRKQRLFVF
jgi:hypothetical protein